MENSGSGSGDSKKTKTRTQICETNEDIIGDAFWTENEHLLKPFRET